MCCWKWLREAGVLGFSGFIQAMLFRSLNFGWRLFMVMGFVTISIWLAYVRLVDFVGCWIMVIGVLC